MLSFTTLAVTVAEADAYCTARGISDWTGSNALKEAALRRGQDYIAGEYNSRWTYLEYPDGVTSVWRLWEDATAPDAVKYAIFEAAAREIKVPFCLSPDLTPGREKVLTAVKGIQWTPIGGGVGGLKPYLTAVDLLLRGYATGGGLGGGSVQLLRA